MQITTFGKNIKVTDGIKNHVEKEFGRLDSIVPDQSTLKVSVSAVHRRNGSCRAEATLNIDGDIVRAECESPNLYDSVNEASDILIRRVKKYNQMHRNFSNATIRTDRAEVVDIPEAEDETIVPEITRVKNIDIVKENRDDASLRMDFLGHPFHLFIDAETGAPAVAYKRGDGSVGVLLSGTGQEVR